MEEQKFLELAIDAAERMRRDDAAEQIAAQGLDFQVSSLGEEDATLFVIEIEDAVGQKKQKSFVFLAQDPHTMTLREMFGFVD